MAWQAWNSFPDITTAFSQVALQPYTNFDAKSPHFRMLERHTVLLYNKSSTMEHVGKARMELFCHENKAM